MDAGPPLIRLAVFGKPIRQSLSPRIHGLFARHCDLEVDYQAIEADAESFPIELTDLTQRGALGCNITAPLKRVAWQQADQSSDNANRAEAVNTLVFRGEGDCFGDNTDGGGLVNDLESSGDWRLAGQRICLLGAGGAAAGVLAALLKAGAAGITLVNRTPERAIRLQQGHADLGEIEISDIAGLDSQTPFDLVINATSLGHRGKAPPLLARWLQANGRVYDMNYGPAADPLRRVCAEQELDYSDGLGMLVGQAALSFEIWTGKAPPAATVLAQLRETL